MAVLHPCKEQGFLKHQFINKFGNLKEYQISSPSIKYVLSQTWRSGQWPPSLTRAQGSLLQKVDSGKSWLRG